MNRTLGTLCALVTIVTVGCRNEHPAAPPAAAAPHPSILFVTFDTTRADAIGPEQHNVDTPSFNALASRGLRFRYAYAYASPHSSV